MGAESTSPCAQVKHLADLLRNRATNSQWYSSIYEDRRPKIEDIERSDDRKTSRTNLTSLKPAEDFSLSFFSLLFSPSVLSFFLFLFLLSSLLPPLPFFSSFPTGETIKPGAVKRPELDPNRGHPNNRDSETDFTLILQRTCKVGAVNTSTPAERGNAPKKERPTDNNGRRRRREW